MSDEHEGCKTHPCAPHGFDRNQSHTEDRYVCECDYWRPDRNCAAERLRADHVAEVEALKAALREIRDSTFRNSTTLRAMADRALGGS